MILCEFIGFFLFILIFGYLIPAGHFYYRYHVNPSPELELLRIQESIASKEQIQREVWMSVQSILIFAIGSTLVLELFWAGKTNIYYPVTSQPIWYAVVSFAVCVFLFDTYFYWTHRFMHWRPVFKYLHLDHHRSVTPTPFAIFAFSPWEAIIQFFGLALLIVFLPMCPLVLMLFLSYDTMMNIGGHNGFEIIPDWVAKVPFLNRFNTVGHHDAHHTNVSVNYGSFTNFWDRWMGTFHD